MRFRDRLRRVWFVVLKNTLNRLTSRLAHGPRGPFSIVRHVGRRSGKEYETPIIVQPIEGGFVIALTYGPDVSWYKNVVAAGGCTVLRHRVSYVVNAIEPLTADTAIAAFPPFQRRVLRLLGEKHFVKFVVAGSSSPDCSDQ